MDLINKVPAPSSPLKCSKPSTPACPCLHSFPLCLIISVMHSKIKSLSSLDIVHSLMLLYISKMSLIINYLIFSNWLISLYMPSNFVFVLLKGKQIFKILHLCLGLFNKIINVKTLFLANILLRSHSVLFHLFHLFQFERTGLFSLFLPSSPFSLILFLLSSRPHSTKYLNLCTHNRCKVK